MVLGLLESHNDDQTFALWLDAHRLKIAELLRISQGPPPHPNDQFGMLWRARPGHAAVDYQCYVSKWLRPNGIIDR